MDQTPTTSDGVRPAAYGLDLCGIHDINRAYWNLGSAQLAEHAVARREGTFAANGALVVGTGQFTGRSPKDKFVVRDETTERTIQWGAVNQPMTPAHFDRIHARMMAFWPGRDVYVQDCLAGADPRYALPLSRCHATGLAQSVRAAAFHPPGAFRKRRASSPISRSCSRPICAFGRTRMAPIRKPVSSSVSPGGWC